MSAPRALTRLLPLAMRREPPFATSLKSLKLTDCVAVPMAAWLRAVPSAVPDARRSSAGGRGTLSARLGRRHQPDRSRTQARGASGSWGESNCRFTSVRGEMREGIWSVVARARATPSSHKATTASGRFLALSWAKKVPSPAKCLTAPSCQVPHPVCLPADHESSHRFAGLSSGRNQEACIYKVNAALAWVCRSRVHVPSQYLSGGPLTSVGSGRSEVLV